MAVEPKWLPTQRAAEYMGFENRRTLERWRANGVGPRYSKCGGKILYRIADLDAWVEAGMVDPAEAVASAGARRLAVAS